MPIREGGSYAVDPKTGRETLVERTDPGEHATASVADTEPAPPAPAEPEQPAEAEAQPGKARKTREA